MWIKQLITSHTPYTVTISKLVRSLFPTESANNIKIKITHHRVIRDGCIWEGTSIRNAC